MSSTHVSTSTALEPIGVHRLVESRESWRGAHASHNQKEFSARHRSVSEFLAIALEEDFRLSVVDALSV
jgi:hypothetical protein